jgi:enolase-phosphatase E1
MKREPVAAESLVVPERQASATVLADVNTILLDIEGTTTPIAFVYDVLFPFVRAHLRAYLSDLRNRQQLAEPLCRLREEWQSDTEDPSRPDSNLTDDPEAVAARVIWLMDRDRKSRGLKLLQGQMWEEGYRSGALRGEIFADVAPALRRWRDSGLTVAIYSSGSELAQRLLFSHTASGDLTPLLTRFFDTAIGPKVDAHSYRQIASQLNSRPERMLFCSDVSTELDAARLAGYQVSLCVRPGNAPSSTRNYPVIETFDDLAPLQSRGWNRASADP